MAKKTTKQTKIKKVSNKQKIGIGVGLTAAAVAAAGAYFLYGSPKSAQNRKKVKSWMLKAKAEVLEALEDAQEMTEAEFQSLVEAATGAYTTAKTASSREIGDFKKEMMDHWKKIERTAPARKVKTAAEKAVRRVSKKVAKKVVRKKTAQRASRAKKKSAKKIAKKTTKKQAKKK